MYIEAKLSVKPRIALRVLLTKVLSRCVEKRSWTKLFSRVRKSIENTRKLYFFAWYVTMYRYFDRCKLIPVLLHVR